MKRLTVKTLSQKKGSLDCGPICVRMILHYFGIEKSEKAIKKRTSYEKEGTSIYDNGIAFLEEDLDVTLITANPLVFDKEVQGKLKSKKVLFKALDAFQKKKPKQKKQVHLFKKFIARGGKFAVEIPTFDHIQKAIEKNQPVLALLYGRALGSKEGGFHFVVVSGYRKNAVFINNPLPGSKGGWFPNKDFLYALHASTCRDIGNGSLLIIGK